MKQLIALFVMLATAGCTGMLLGSSPSGDSAPTTRQAGGATAADGRISGAIRQQYNADSEISQFPVGIRSVGGRVTLTGTVRSFAVRDRVVDIARNTQGVVSVDSRVVVNTNY